MVSSGDYEKIRWGVWVAWIVSAFSSKWIGWLPWFILFGFIGVITLLKSQQRDIEALTGIHSTVSEASESWPEFVNNLEHY